MKKMWSTDFVNAIRLHYDENFTIIIDDFFQSNINSEDIKLKSLGNLILKIYES